MSRSSIGARLASVGGATLLIAGLFAQAAPVLAAAPAHVARESATFAPASASSAVHQGPTASVNVKAIARHGTSKLPFNAKTVGKILQAAEATTNPSASTKPNVVGPPDPDLATGSGAPAPTTPVAVAGQSGTGTSLGPDSGVAVGPDEVLQTANTALTISDRAGGSLPSVPATSLPDLFALSESGGHTTFDAEPRILFDTVRQRWIATELSWDCAIYKVNPADPTNSFGHGFLDYAISDTADPTGIWTSSSFYWVDLLPDRPSVGSTTDKLALSATIFNMQAGGGNANPNCIGTTNLGSSAIVVDWTELGPDFNSPASFESASYSNLDALRIAAQEPIVDADVRMVGLANGTASGEADGDLVYVDLAGSAVKGTVTEARYSDLSLSIIAQSTVPNPPHQPGGTLTTALSGAPDSVIYNNGVLAFASAYPCTPTGDTLVRDCIRVTELDSASPNAIPTRGGDTLLGTNGVDSTFGAIAFAGNGILHAVYTESSASLDPSSFTQYNQPADAPTAWSAPHGLSTGAAAYTGTGWGAAPIVSTDTQDPAAVWVADPAASGSGGWATTIHELVVGGAGDGYTPISPVRVLDTRTPNPIGLSGVFNANVARTFPVAGFIPTGSLVAAIPADAVAITGNLTVTQQTAAGYVSLTPTPTNSPASSTLNFPLGDNRANNVTIALAPDGHLSAVYKAAAGKHTALILDVTGYFLAGSGQTYHPTSGRILDTRFATGLTGPFVANTARSFLVAGATDSSSTVVVPIDATAITANLTVVGQTHAGYVSLTPTPNNAPATSTINFPIGDTRANGLTIAIDPLTGDVSAVYKAPTGSKVSLILDVTGYYTATGGLLFHPLNPGRRVDTRFSAGFDGFGNGLTGAQSLTPRSVAVALHDGVPSTASAITGNLTVVGQNAGGFVSVTATSDAHPTTSTINFPIGDNRANGITAPLGTAGDAGKLWFVYPTTAGHHVQLILDVTGYFE